MAFKFNDSAPLRDNLAAYSRELAQLDAILGPVLAARLDDIIADGDPAEILDELMAALATPSKASS
ncbi:hypothetical protein [Bradyrhizobium sp. I1.7.5]|uniref:hypothetical protein n=1 Tax=Bradyrhizobium sp. I1.7.5 TaxID=3156363 RepID=UPI003395478A